MASNDQKPAEASSAETKTRIDVFITEPLKSLTGPGQWEVRSPKLSIEVTTGSTSLAKVKEIQQTLYKEMTAAWSRNRYWNHTEDTELNGKWRKEAEKTVRKVLVKEGLNTRISSKVHIRLMEEDLSDNVRRVCRVATSASPEWTDGAASILAENGLVDRLIYSKGDLCREFREVFCIEQGTERFLKVVPNGSRL